MFDFSKFNTILGYLLLITLAIFIYYMIKEKQEQFVPMNAFEVVPESLSPELWKSVNEKFGTLVRTVNNGQYAISFELSQLLDTFKQMLNEANVGKYIIVSVGKVQQFVIFDVIIQDIETLAVTKFKRVDFITDSMNPFKMQKVIITPDYEWSNEQKELSASDPSKKISPFFRINNPLHLFAPYKTSDNEMYITPQDDEVFNIDLQKKSKEREVLVKNVNGNKYVPEINPSSDPPLILETVPEKIM